MADLSPPTPALPDPAKLPHGPGFRFVTEVLTRERDDDGNWTGQALWTVNGDESFLEHHFPGDPIVPRVLLIGALAQFSGLLHFEHRSNEPPLRAGIARADVLLKRPVAPPAEIVLSSAVQETNGPLITFAVSARVQGQLVARGDILLTQALKG